MKHLFSCLMLILTLSTPVLAVNNDQSYLEQSIPAVEDEDLRIILNEEFLNIETNKSWLYQTAEEIISSSGYSLSPHNLVNAFKDHLKQPHVEQKFFKIIQENFQDNEIKAVATLFRETNLSEHLIEIRLFQYACLSESLEVVLSLFFEDGALEIDKNAKITAEDQQLLQILKNGFFEVKLIQEAFIECLNETNFLYYLPKFNEAINTPTYQRKFINIVKKHFAEGDLEKVLDLVMNKDYQKYALPIIDLISPLCREAEEQFQLIAQDDNLTISKAGCPLKTLNLENFNDALLSHNPVIIHFHGDIEGKAYRIMESILVDLNEEIGDLCDFYDFDIEFASRLPEDFDPFNSLKMRWTQENSFPNETFVIKQKYTLPKFLFIKDGQIIGVYDKWISKERLTSKIKDLFHLDIDPR